VKTIDCVMTHLKLSGENNRLCNDTFKTLSGENNRLCNETFKTLMIFIFVVYAT